MAQAPSSLPGSTAGLTGCHRKLASPEVVWMGKKHSGPRRPTGMAWAPRDIIAAHRQGTDGVLPAEAQNKEKVENNHHKRKPWQRKQITDSVNCCLWPGRACGVPSSATHRRPSVGAFPGGLAPGASETLSHERHLSCYLTVSQGSGFLHLTNMTSSVS